MSRRIDIELTSARDDGSWTWRAAGAQKPKGVLDGSILPEGSKAGDVLKVDVETEVDGITVLGVVMPARARRDAERIELLGSDRPFEPVTQTLARRERGDRPRRDRDRDRPRGRGEDRPRRDGPGADRGPRPDGARSGDRGPGRNRPSRPRFDPPPELPQRPRPKRLKPGKAHRNAVLAALPEEQRPIAEKALAGGIPAVRQAVNEQNAALRAEGKTEVPAAGLLKMAEELLPRLRVAEWLDRADAAKADLTELDLRDLRSVVAAGEDPVVARDESTRELAAELKAALASKQETATSEWLEDIGAALGVGRVIRALKLSAEPPKAGVRFPPELGAQLAGAATASLTVEATAERWSAVLEAVAFSPIRAAVTPPAPADQTTDELRSTVTRLAALIPQIAALFGITPTPGGQPPKPLRPTRKGDQRKPAGGAAKRPGNPRRSPAEAPSAAERAPEEVDPNLLEAARAAHEATGRPVAEPIAEEATQAAAEAVAETAEEPAAPVPSDELAVELTDANRREEPTPG